MRGARPETLDFKAYAGREMRRRSPPHPALRATFFLKGALSKTILGRGS